MGRRQQRLVPRRHLSQRALFNLRLPDNNNADTYLFIKDVSATGSNIKATFENRTGATGSFNIAIVTQDDNGELSVVGNQQMITGMAAGSTQTRTFNLKGKLTEGTYRLSPASKATRNTVWRPKFNLYNHYIDADPSELLQMPKMDRRIPVVLSVEEIDAMIHAIDLSLPEGQRNRAIIEMLYGSGLRVSELVGLKLSNMYLNDDYMLIEGKGSKQRSKIGSCAFGETLIILFHLSSYLDHIDSVVADTLKIADAVKQFGNCTAVFISQAA